MNAVCIASPREWETVLKYYNVNEKDCVKYPFGSYFSLQISGCDVLFFLSGSRKTNASAAVQYIIDRMKPDKIIVIGCCAGISSSLKPLDIIIPHKTVQTDTTVKELDSLIREDFTVDIDISRFLEGAIEGTIEGAIEGTNGGAIKETIKEPFFSGVLACSDKALVMWDDFIELKENGIDAADTESASIAYVCRANDIPCCIIRGITDFPLDISPAEASSPNSPQIKSFLKNLPIVIEKILKDYLEFFCD